MRAVARQEGADGLQGVLRAVAPLEAVVLEDAADVLKDRLINSGEPPRAQRLAQSVLDGAHHARRAEDGLLLLLKRC